MTKRRSLGKARRSTINKLRQRSFGRLQRVFLLQPSKSWLVSEANSRFCCERSLLHVRGPADGDGLVQYLPHVRLKYTVTCRLRSGCFPGCWQLIRLLYAIWAIVKCIAYIASPIASLEWGCSPRSFSQCWSFLWCYSSPAAADQHPEARAELWAALHFRQHLQDGASQNICHTHSNALLTGLHGERNGIAIWGGQGWPPFLQGQARGECVASITVLIWDYEMEGKQAALS